MDRRRRAKRAERHAAANRAAAEERRAAAAAAAQRAVAEERRAAAAQVAAAEERRAAAVAAQGAAAEEPRAAAAVAAPLPARQAVPDPAANERLGPTCSQMYKTCWGKPNTNHVAADKTKGRQGLPLPTHAPGIENQFFQLKKKKTGNALVDLLLAEMYDDVYNDIGDTRREILHSISRKDQVTELRLSGQLAGLMEKANAKIKHLFDSTGHLVSLPEHFLKYPALNK